MKSYSNRTINPIIPYLSTLSSKDFNELQKFTKDKRRTDLLSALRKLLCTIKLKNPLEREPEFRQAVQEFNLESFFADSNKRTKFESHFDSIDQSTRVLLNSLKVYKNVLSDLTLVSNEIKGLALEQHNIDEATKKRQEDMNNLRQNKLVSSIEDVSNPELLKEQYMIIEMPKETPYSPDTVFGKPNWPRHLHPSMAELLSFNAPDRPRTRT